MLAYNVEKTPDLHTSVAFMNLNQGRLQNMRLKGQHSYSSAGAFAGLCARGNHELRFRSCTEEAGGQVLMRYPC